ncbi:MAG: hypothetical protein QM790_00675 [Nibricoccus sp.]
MAVDTPIEAASVLFGYRPRRWTILVRWDSGEEYYSAEQIETAFLQLTGLPEAPAFVRDQLSAKIAADYVIFLVPPEKPPIFAEFIFHKLLVMVFGGLAL